MLTVNALRWIFGYVDFEVTGKFPERFINLATKNGINMWNLGGTKNTFSASAKSGLYLILEQLAQKNGNEIHILKYHGLPYLCRKYQNRAGLLVGLILFIAICIMMSGFVWNIKIDAPAEFNEYEIREELRKMGLTEGKWSKSIDTESMERELAVKNKKISWIAVNILGSDVEVVISGKAESGTKQEQSYDASNIKSMADGTVTRMEIRKGRAAIKIGDGVRKNQLLVSGIIEYTNGTSSFVDAEANIYANTSKSVEMKLPKKAENIKIGNPIQTKAQFSAFGVIVPVMMGYRPNSPYMKQTTNYQAILFDKTLPIYFSEEIFYQYEKQLVKYKTSQAENILRHRTALYEVFMLYSVNSGTIKNKTLSYSENKDFFILRCNYIIEENIGIKSAVYIE